MPGNPAGDEVNVFIQGLNYFLLVYHLHLKKRILIYLKISQQRNLPDILGFTF